MSGSWREFADRLTSTTREQLETAERGGADPAELRRFAEQILEHDSFQLACDAVADGPDEAVAATGWMLPDDRHSQTYREVVIASAAVGEVTVDTTTDVDLDGRVLAAFIYLTADLVSLSAAEAREVADELRRAADRLESL